MVVIFDAFKEYFYNKLNFSFFEEHLRKNIIKRDFWIKSSNLIFKNLHESVSLSILESIKPYQDYELGSYQDFTGYEAYLQHWSPLLLTTLFRNFLTFSF